MAKMNIAPDERVRVKLDCLRLLIRLKLNQARMRLISGFIDRYLNLNMQEQAEFDAELKGLPFEDKEEVMEIVTSWMEEGLRRGLREGRREGIEEGQLKAIRDGVVDFGSALQKSSHRPEEHAQGYQRPETIEAVVAPGCDRQTLKDFERRLTDLL